MSLSIEEKRKIAILVLIFSLISLGILATLYFFMDDSGAAVNIKNVDLTKANENFNSEYASRIQKIDDLEVDTKKLENQNQEINSILEKSSFILKIIGALLSVAIGFFISSYIMYNIEMKKV